MDLKAKRDQTHLVNPAGIRRMEPEAGQQKCRAKEEAHRPAGAVLFLSLSDGRPEKAPAKNLLSGAGRYPAVRQTGRTDGISAEAWDHHPGTALRVP